MTSPIPSFVREATNVNSSKRPVILVMSILAGLQFIAGGAMLADFIGKQAAGLFILFVGALQAGIQFYVQNQVTPWSTVVSKVNDAGTIVAGPAAAVATGVVVSEPQPVSEVVPVEPEPEVSPEPEPEPESQVQPLVGATSPETIEYDVDETTPHDEDANPLDHVGDEASAPEEIGRLP